MGRAIDPYLSPATDPPWREQRPSESGRTGETFWFALDPQSAFRFNMFELTGIRVRPSVLPPSQQTAEPKPVRLVPRWPRLEPPGLAALCVCEVPGYGRSNTDAGNSTTGGNGADGGSATAVSTASADQAATIGNTCGRKVAAGCPPTRR